MSQVNGASAKFADVFTVRGIKKNPVDVEVAGSTPVCYLLLCAQCKLYFWYKINDDVEKEIKKNREALRKYLSSYNDNWLLVVYVTRILDFQIDQSIILDSIGMERPTMVERAFHLLEHRKLMLTFLTCTNCNKHVVLATAMHVWLLKNVKKVHTRIEMI